MSYKKIMEIIPTMQSISLVNENFKLLKKKKKLTTKDMIGLGAKNIIGTSLIKVNADLIGGL